MLITVFTPTYNRAYRLVALYQSLCNQTSQDFEWLIVDDGSTDNTSQLVEKWNNENKITIRYFWQPNGGKHRAINRGVKEANGKMFFIVDSDDKLSDDAIEWISKESEHIMDIKHLAGISGICITSDGSKVGGGPHYDMLECNVFDFRLKHRIKGDMAEVFKTDILRKFPFPEYDGEKFCPEALVWLRIGRHYWMRFFYKGIYICEYLPDGLTAKIVKIRRNSPLASMIFYSEQYHDQIPIIYKFKAAINFWRFQSGKYQRHYKMLNILSLIGYIPGKLMRLNDSFKY